MKRRRIHHTLRHRTISKQISGQKSAPVERHLNDRKQPWTQHESCLITDFYSILRHYAVKLKVVKTFQKFVRGKNELWQVNVLSLSMPLYGTLFLFRTSFPGARCFYTSCSGSDVSTCKPYSLPRQIKPRALGVVLSTYKQVGEAVPTVATSWVKRRWSHSWCLFFYVVWIKFLGFIIRLISRCCSRGGVGREIAVLEAWLTMSFPTPSKPAILF